MMSHNLFAVASLVGQYIPAGASDIRFANLAFTRCRPPAPGLRGMRGGARVMLDPSECPTPKRGYQGGTTARPFGLSLISVQTMAACFSMLGPMWD